MGKTKITAPTSFTGPGPGGVSFDKGVAYTDNEAVLSYCAGAGYGIGGDQPDPPRTPAQTDARDVTDTTVGSRLRDGAVDPSDVDFLPPTNAGQADPHGPLVVGPEIHSSGTQVVRPGPVHDDLTEQQAAETEQARQLLVERQDAGDVTGTADPDTGKGPLGLSDPGSVTSDDTGDAATADAFDPAGHTVEQVRAHLADADDTERARVLGLEAAGKARVTLLES